MTGKQKAKQGENPIPSGILSVLGLAVALGSLRYEFGSFASPGAGFLPFLAGGIITILSAITFFGNLNLRKKNRPPGELWKGVRWQRVAIVPACLILYAVFLRDLGFVISTILLMVYFFRMLEPSSWKETLFAAVVTTFGFYLVFHIWLQAQLPKGLLGL